MLFLVGLGLSEKEIPIGTMEACRNCELYIDKFTSMVEERTTDYITEQTGKRITELTRQDMEEDAKDIVQRAKTKDIAILVGGDPLMATTHKILYIEAERQNVKTQIVHANSIITTAIGESGLDFYRFGAPCTIPKWSHHYSPVSFYEKIEANLVNKNHTILLLDYDSKSKTTIAITDAINALEKADAHYKKGIINNKTKIILLHNMSLEDGKVISTTIENAKTLDYSGVNIIILPAELTDIEKEAVFAITGKKW
jgi:diphthine synthase